MPKENTTNYIILGLLTHGDMTGYDVKRRIDISINSFWDVGYAQIYPTFKKLEKNGFVTKSIHSKLKGPERIVYGITDSGREELTKWLKNNNEKDYVKYGILLKLFFGNLLPVDENINKILEFRNKNYESYKNVEEVCNELQKILTTNQDHWYYYLTALFGKYVYKAYMDWAEEAENVLRNLETKTEFINED